MLKSIGFVTNNALALMILCIPFVLSTIYFGIRKGENNYYDTDKYDGNGTAH